MILASHGLLALKGLVPQTCASQLKAFAESECWVLQDPASHPSLHPTPVGVCALPRVSTALFNLDSGQIPSKPWIL